MLRRLLLSTLLFATTAGGVLTLAAQDPPADSRAGKGGKGKKEKGDRPDREEKERAKAEKWAMKLAKADPETAERWAMELARKEREKAEKEFLKDQEKAYRQAQKAGTIDPPPAKDEAKTDPRPTVLRYGSLPKEVPKWWADVDADRDVQLSLYEWRTANRKVDDFTALDRNNDGYLTVEEYLRATAPEEPRKK